jgi:phosphohistidine phosphatase
MKRLILLRHAKSAWNHPELSDFDRPLNKRGEQNAPTMGERLRKRGVQPQCIISSPAKRARETTRLLAGQLANPETTVIFADDIYAADPPALLATIRNFPRELECVMLVGHNPGLTDLANLLGPARFENLPTCAAVGLELRIDRWAKIAPATGTLWFYDYPKNPEPVPDAPAPNLSRT